MTTRFGVIFLFLAMVAVMVIQAQPQMLSEPQNEDRDVSGNQDPEIQKLASEVKGEAQQAGEGVLGQAKSAAEQGKESLQGAKESVQQGAEQAGEQGKGMLGTLKEKIGMND